MTRYILDTPVGYKAFWLPMRGLPYIRVCVAKPSEHIWGATPVGRNPSFEVEDYFPTDECIPVLNGERLMCARIYRRKL